MATQTYPGTVGGGSQVNKTAAATFIPEIWSDEVIAAYQKNLKMAPLVKKLPMTGKKGDTIHIPKPIRGAASAKVADTAVNIQANVEGELQISVDRHFEYSRFIEDIVEVQALNSLRQFYTEDAGYQLALKVDNDLHAAATGFGDGTMDIASPARADYEHSATFFNDNGTTTAFGSGSTLVAAEDIFTDEFFRDMIQKLDDNDVPMDGRCLIVPPSARNAIMGEDRFSSTDFVSGQTVNTGLIGNLYGVDVYVSSNCATIASGIRAGLLFHKDAIVHAEQMSVRSQTQYKQEYLSTLYTADTLYGVNVYRPEAGFVLALAE